MAIQSHKLVLLTGAGFTKNFDGFTGREMWSKIFNHPAIQRSPELHSLLQENFDFEYVYGKVLTGNYSDHNKDIMRLVVEAVYKKLDDATRTWVFNNSNPTALDIYKLMKIVDLFGVTGQRGFFFTLNQDLFMERNYNYCSLAAPRFPLEISGGIAGQPFSAQSWVTLPADDPMKRVEAALENHSGLHYVKLHGSYGWKSSDGSNQMVLGKDKEDAIQKEPLLRQYLELFQGVIKEGGKRLLVIGYGFRDIHINKILLDGVQNHGLKLIVVSTTSPEDFRQNFINGHYYALDIMTGLMGYIDHSLREIFPSSQAGSVHLDDLQEMLLRVE